MDLPANMRPGAFIGTAEVYARYRPPYPPQLLADLVASVDGAHRFLVDLATGPGRVALDLAASFERVLGVDLEPEMIELARRRATDRGLGNIAWQVGRAEDVDLVEGSVDLVTIGEAFHRLDQALVARRALGWLRPGGCLATLGANERFTGTTPWEQALSEVCDRWMARAFPEGWGLTMPGQAPGAEAREHVLIEAGFASVEVHELDAPVELRFEDIIGHLESTSTCSRHALGEGFDEFAEELRATIDPGGNGRFVEAMRWGYTLARKAT